jgi:hypothetical protein
MNLSANEISTITEITKLKLIEDRYLTLKRYLRLYCKKHNLITSEEIEMIINALEDEPIVEEMEKEENE